MCPIHKHHLNSLNINITTHLVQQMGRNIVNCSKFDRNAWECVCVCLQKLFYRPKHLKHLQSIFQFILGMGQILGKK